MTKRGNKLLGFGGDEEKDKSYQTKLKISYGDEEENTEEDSSSKPQKVKISPEYKKLMDNISRNYKGEEREAVYHILSTPKAQETYKVLKDEGIPERTVYNLMSHGMRDFQRDKHISLGSYTTAVAQEIVKLEQYPDVVEEMYKDGILNERQYKEVIGEVKGQTGKRIGLFKSGLEALAKKAAVILLSFYGFLMILLSKTSYTITGGVIGTTRYSSGYAILGFALIIAGIFIHLKDYKK